MTKSNNVNSTPISVEPSWRITLPAGGIIVGHTQAELDSFFSFRGIFSAANSHQQIPRIAVAVQATAIDDNANEEMPELIAVDNN